MRRSQFPASNHFDGERFFNPGGAKARGLADVLRWKLTSRSARWNSAGEMIPLAAVPERVDGSGVRATFVNHATMLVQFRGCNILTDPIWSDRASPLAWAGPKRHRPPGVRWQDLPRIDLVLLSHNHYDHLDEPTIRRLIREHRPEFVAPLGVAPLIRSFGAMPVAELDWWDVAEAAGVRVTSVPAQHFSARGLWDRNRTLWCGYMIDTPVGRVYFAGDTGFGPHFAEIRERLGAPQLALLPIGAYKPEWFMGPVHMRPAEAVEAHRILEAATSIAIHFGTFQLTDEAQDDPERELRKALGTDSRPFLALRNGEHLCL